MRCPICGLQWPAQIACCPCGFAPSAIDEFVVRLRLERKRGIARQLLGLLLGSTMIPIWFVLSGVEGAMLIPIVTATFFVSGGIVFVRATQTVIQSTRRLRAVTAMRQLPVARIVD